MTESKRPAAQLIKDAYDHLFHSGLSLSKLKDAALGGRLFHAHADAMGTPGRSMAWKVARKIFLDSSQPLQPSTDSEPIPPLDALRTSRKRYVDLMLEKMRAPDGSYDDGFSIPGSSVSSRKTQKTASDLETNNPLSLHNENPWKEWFASVELRKTISQDVERTFPEIGYFRDAQVQHQLTNILFLHSVTTPNIGYRQGMHELLAPLYFAVDYDSVSDVRAATEDSTLQEFCSRSWVAADSWMIFDTVMRSVGKWYEWQEPPLSLNTKKSPLDTHVHISVPNGQVEIRPYVAPIVQVCNYLQGTLLRSVDPILWKQMQAAGIEPQIYGIRWLRLLFTREFSMRDAMVLWDGLFASEPSFDLAHWLCVAMLLRIRNYLIPSDYSGQLTYLLHYPPPPSPAESEAFVDHAGILLRQALALQMSSTPATGVSVVVENRNLLHIPLEVPEAPPTLSRRRGFGQGMREKSASTSEERDSGSNRGVHGRQHSSQIGIPEMIARGLLDRGESLGINKTLMNAVSEIRRNLPDLAASLVRNPTTPSASYASFPLSDETPAEERPPWEPRTRFEMEKDIADLRSMNKKLGESVGRIVDALLQDEEHVREEEKLRALHNRKREALESLSYVRDILMGRVSELEDDRLLGEEESKKQKELHQRTSSTENRQSPPVEVPRPVATPSSLESRLKAAVTSPPHTSAPVAPSSSPPKAFSSPSVPVQSLANPFTTSTGLSNNSTRFAPWNYTRTNFGGTALPTTALPRLPPPTSASYRSHSPASGFQQPSPEPPTRRETQNHDPLGVLK